MPEREEQLMSIAAREWKAEGRIEGRIEVLLHILQRRFGPLPQATCEKVRTGSPAKIDAWLDRAIDATTLDAIFGSMH